MAKEAEKEESEAKGGGKKKIILIAVPVVILLAGLAWFFLKPSEAAGPVVLPPPVPGEVLALDPITVNLAGGHFLKFGMALQPVAAASSPPNGSKALDLAINQFSQMTVDELSGSEGRNKAKQVLLARIKLSSLPPETDIAAVLEGGEVEESSAEDADSKDPAHHLDVDAYTDEQVVKMAEALEVQPEMYDLYFTEFVMQ